MNISITVDVEEWFHSSWFDPKQIIKEHYGGKTPKTDLMEKIKDLINLFDKNGVRATFFILGETAAKYPKLMDMFEGSPHELACHGFWHNKKYDDHKEFQSDLKKFKNEISSDMKGFRFPYFSNSTEKLKILVEEGFSYDSSVVPCLKIPGFYGEFDAPLVPYNNDLGNGNSIVEFPISVLPYLRLPGSGGWFLRNFGYLWTKTILKSSVRKLGYGVIYIHPWEISDNNPNLKGIPFHVFRNTGSKTFKNLKRLIEDISEANFITLAEQLQLRKE